MQLPFGVLNGARVEIFLVGPVYRDGADIMSRGGQQYIFDVVDVTNVDSALISAREESTWTGNSWATSCAIFSAVDLVRLTR